MPAPHHVQPAQSPSPLRRIAQRLFGTKPAMDDQPPARPPMADDLDAVDTRLRARPDEHLPPPKDQERDEPDATLPLPPGEVPPGPANTAVLGNSLPKSGTHMLNQTIDFLGRWANTGMHININGYRLIHPSSNGLLRCPAAQVVPRLRAGYTATAHLAYDPDIDAFLQSEPGQRVRHVFMVRDPRDLIVSWMRYATYSKTYWLHGPNRPMQKHLREDFDSDADRLMFAIEERTKFPYRKYAGWVASPATRIVRFEDLHDALEAAGRDELHPSMRDLLAFLGVEPESLDLQAFHAHAFGKSRTSMRDKFRPSSFRDSFEDRHHEAVDTPFWRQAVASFGYDW